MPFGNLHRLQSFHTSILLNSQNLPFPSLQVLPLFSGSVSAADVTRPPVIGILGGIGSGKSSVIRHVTGFDLRVIDADKIGHELLTDQDIHDQLRAAFGEDIFSDSATVNRSNLAERVFGQTPEHQTALKQLNEILHPAIRREIHRQIDSVSRDADAVILDAALLLEGGWDATCDWLIFIDTPFSVRQERVQKNRGWSADEISKREATQIDLVTKKDRANFVVDNAGTLEASALQMTEILSSILNSN